MTHPELKFIDGGAVLGLHPSIDPSVPAIMKMSSGSERENTAI